MSKGNSLFPLSVSAQIFEFPYFGLRIIPEVKSLNCLVTTAQIHTWCRPPQVVCLLLLSVWNLLLRETVKTVLGKGSFWENLTLAHRIFFSPWNTLWVILRRLYYQIVKTDIKDDFSQNSLPLCTDPAFKTPFKYMFVWWFSANSLSCHVHDSQTIYTEEKPKHKLSLNINCAALLESSILKNFSLTSEFDLCLVSCNKMFIEN